MGDFHPQNPNSLSPPLKVKIFISIFLTKWIFVKLEKMYNVHIICSTKLYPELACHLTYLNVLCLCPISLKTSLFIDFPLRRNVLN